MVLENKFLRSSVTTLLIVLFCLSGCLFTSKQDDPPSPSVLLHKMLGDLRSKIPGKSLRISIGNFTYQDSSVPSSFARYLSQEEIEESFQPLGQANERSLKEIADRGMVVEVDSSGRKGETAEDVCLYTIVV